jgi:ribosome-associated protein
MNEDLPISRTKVIPGRALDVKTARASGPGGQHVNRTESKVQLTLDPREVSWLEPGARLRMVALAGRNVDGEGRIHVVSQEHREQSRNLDDARTKLAELVTKALVRPKTRVATKPSKRAKARRVDEKKARGKTKATRGRVSRDD